MVPERGRKRRFAYTTMKVWPSSPVNREHKTNTHRGHGSSFYSRLHPFATSTQQNLFFLKPNKMDVDAYSSFNEVQSIQPPVLSSALASDI